MPTPDHTFIDSTKKTTPNPATAPDISGLSKTDLDNYAALRQKGFNSKESLDMGVNNNQKK